MRCNFSLSLSFLSWRPQARRFEDGSQQLVCEMVRVFERTGVVCARFRAVYANLCVWNVFNECA